MGYGVPVRAALQKLLPGIGGTGVKAAATKAAPQLTRFAAGPFMQNVLGIGLGTAGLGLAGAIPGYRDKVIEDMISKPPGTDGYDRGPFGINNLLMLPSREDLDAKRTDRLEDMFADQLSMMRRGGLGDDANVNPNKTDKQNRAKLDSFQTLALAGIQDQLDEQKFLSPINQMIRANERLERDRRFRQDQQVLDQNFQMRVDELNARISRTEGEQALQKLQLLGVQDLNREKLDVYRQQMSQKSENDRYRTTAGLISGIGALAASFAM